MSVTPESIEKGLNVLASLAGMENVSKGHASRGTKNTEVESMSGQSGDPQLFHTGSDSDPGTWAGTSQKPVPDNGPGVDSVSENGTDYVAQSKMAKSIMEKIEKGQALTPDERIFFKGMMAIQKGSYGPSPADADAAGFKPVKKSKDEDDAEKGGFPFKKDDDKDDEDAKKSLADFASENETVQKGLEVSEFLFHYADVMHKSLSALEARLVGHIDARLAEQSARSGEFNKSLATAVHDLGQGLAATSQRVSQVEQAPAHAPKSEQVQIQHVEKSFGNGDEDGQDLLKGLSKGDIANVMVDLVKGGELEPRAVIAYESTQEMTPATAQKVAKHLRGGR